MKRVSHNEIMNPTTLDKDESPTIIGSVVDEEKTLSP
jgi:hypothetical protein